MLNVRLADGHLYGKQLFTWLSLVMSLMASFVLSFFPLDVLDEIWDVTESLQDLGISIKTHSIIHKTSVCHRVLVRYIIHLYCLTVQASFCSDVVE